MKLGADVRQGQLSPLKPCWYHGPIPAKPMKSQIVSSQTRVVRIGATLLLAGVAACAGAATGTRLDPAAQRQLSAAYLRLPLRFEEIAGATTAEAQFLARGSGYAVGLTPTEAVLCLRDRESAAGPDTAQPTCSDPPFPAAALRSTSVRVRLAGANTSARVVGQQPLPGKVNYFVGSDPSQWRTDVPTYRQVVIQRAYPGIDVMYYGREGRLEFDFVVAPGAQADRIRLEFDGTAEISLDAAGNLVVPAGGRELLLHRPVVYQEAPSAREAIPGHYELVSPTSVSFKLGQYDRSRPLIIDPVLSFSTYLGGQWEDAVTAMAVDREGNLCLAGTTYPTGFPTTNALLAPLYPDAFVAKLTADGSTMLFATYLGGMVRPMSHQSFAPWCRLAVDVEGNIVVTGRTQSPDFPVVNAHQPTLNITATNYWAVYPDAFVAKLTPTGNRLVYSTYLGGNFWDGGSAVAVDSEGNAYVAGSTASTNFPTLNALSATAHGTPRNDSLAAQYTTHCIYVPDDVFVSKLSPSGALLYSTYLGGANWDWPTGIAVDSQGIVSLVGETQSADFPRTAGAFQSEFRPWSDAFFLKLGKDGREILYSTYLGGNAGLEVSPGYLTRRPSPLGTPWEQTFRFRNASSQAITITDLYFRNESGTARVDLDEPHEAPSLPFNLAPGQIADIGLKSVETESRLRIYGEIAGQAFRVELEWLKRDEDPGLLATAVAGFNSFDSAGAVALDSGGEAYVAGSFGSLDAPNLGMQRPLPGDYRLISHDNAFVARFGTDNQLKYLILLGGSQWDEASGIVVDSSGSAYVAGRTSSPDFPLRDSLQDQAVGYDALVVKLAPTGEPLMFSTLLGGGGDDSATCVALNPAGDIYVGGSTTSTNFPVVHPIQPVFGSDYSELDRGYPSDGFVARIRPEAVGQCVQLWQKLLLPGAFTSTNTNSVRVQFEWVGANRFADAPVLQVSPTNVLVRVPVNLLHPDDAVPEGPQPDSDLVIRIEQTHLQPPVINQVEGFRLIWPRWLLFDEVFTPPPWAGGAARQLPTSRRTLLQFELANPRLVNDPATLATFRFLGHRTDGMAGVRVWNTARAFPLSLRLGGELSVFEPNALGTGLSEAGFIHFPNLATDNEGLQFNVRRDGFHLVVVEAQTNSPGPFPAPFQIDLAGNVGLPRKLTNGVAEPRRGTRQEVLFNHPAPHHGVLGGGPAGPAETALFKFNNLVSVAIHPVAALIPPTRDGFPLGQAPVRAADPPNPLDRTTPTARTPDLATPQVGSVIDLTQVPVPAEPGSRASVSGTVGALLGPPIPGGAALPLPLTTAGGGSVSSLILDFGSGYELVDGPGNDFVVETLEGSYTVKVGNTPFTDSFKPIGTAVSNTNEFDLAQAGLPSARYVLITAASTARLASVRALRQFADSVYTDVGPVRHETAATVLVRRTKTAENALDPFLQLLGPSAEFYGENESGFGDDLSVDRSDAALIGLRLPLDGFHRYLVKGYEIHPEDQATGSFLTRLETTGAYDKVDLVVSTNDEAGTVPQREGVINQTRQRDSYLFQASPGTWINIVVSGKSSPALPDPLVELYDPEDFLIGANDDAPGRDKNAVLSLVLPPTSGAGTALPERNTYRLVVSGTDRPGAGHSWEGVIAHVREVVGGRYELKVFTGALTEPTTTELLVSSITPDAAPVGTPVVIRGANFGANRADVVVFFGTVSALVRSVSSNEIVTAVPTGLSPGAVAVSVRVAARQSTSVAFTVTEAAEPTPTERTAQARLHCYSLRFRPATATALGETYTLTLTGSFDSASPNGELLPLFQPGDVSYTSVLRLQIPGAPNPVLGEIFLDVPPDTDANANGVVDFFEVSQAVTSVQTEGDFYTDEDSGWVTAMWNRVAGSATGTCLVRAVGDVSGPLPDFVHTFELLEYTGPLNFMPGISNISGSIRLSQSPSSASTLAGSVVVAKDPTNRFNEMTLLAGSWTNAVGQSWARQESRLQRDQVRKIRYSGRVDFADGDPSTAEPDYTAWELTVSDPNDANADGVPDLSDDPVAAPGSRPVLSVELRQGNLWFQIRARIGTRIDLEQTTTLLPANWTKATSLTVAADPETVALSMPDAATRFYRLSAR